MPVKTAHILLFSLNLLFTYKQQVNFILALVFFFDDLFRSKIHLFVNLFYSCIKLKRIAAAILFNFV
ncbi:MAG: hypothetical protein CVU09_16960 [Bacteroidetes bacterium HGW-Bacteroidetes-4]|nr:MAG: hypothetical protein CVU09_16960 [Bacteroidetes bacterium HGW-Bacteroidetes-4]